MSATGNDTSSRVDARFGRAKWFVIVDTKTSGFEAIGNPGAAEQYGAGPKAAERLATQHVDCVITGHCGPNAFQALDALGIDVVAGVNGTVGDAADRLVHGELRAIDRPDVRWHGDGFAASPGAQRSEGEAPAWESEGGEGVVPSLTSFQFFYSRSIIPR